jgi:hypothetical protein
VETFTQACFQKAAVGTKEAVGETGIGAKPALIAIQPGEAVFEEKTGVIKVQRDGVFVGNLIAVFLVVGCNQLENGRNNALAIFIIGNQRIARIKTGSG